MEAPNQVWGLVFTKFFLEKLVLSSECHHSDVTAIFSQNDIIFAMTSQVVEILYSRMPVIRTPYYPNTTLTKVIRAITILTTLTNLKQKI